MRAFILSLAFALIPGFALAQSASADTAASVTKKKTSSAKKTKKASGTEGSTLSTAARAGSGSEVRKPNAAVEDELQPLDVSHMLFDSHSIRQIVQHHMPQIQTCYEKVLATSGQRIEGRVSVGFLIDVTGTVVEARHLPQKSTLSDERVIDCVLLRVRRLIFPKPPDNRRYPIEFPFDLTVKK